MKAGDEMGQLEPAAGISPAAPTCEYPHALTPAAYAAAVASLQAFPEGRANAAEICCDRNAADETKIALIHCGCDGAVTPWTFATLKTLSQKFADVLKREGVEVGDRVAGLLPRSPELLITILATWRIGAVYQPLFTAFGPKAIEHRLVEARTKLVVTDAGNRSKLSEQSVSVPTIVVGAEPMVDDTDFWSALNHMTGGSEAVPRDIDSPFLLMFTSGTTGPAKPLEVPIRAIMAFTAYLQNAVGLLETDRYWNLADPGWAYGLYYAVAAPLAMGVATIFNENPFNVEETYDLINTLGVTNLAGSPTAFRQMTLASVEVATRIRGQLRAVSSAGEPLGSEIVRWFSEYLSVAVNDHYGQTEVGMVVCNHHALDHPVRLGSAGFASPGYKVVVCDKKGVELDPGQPGILAIDREQSPMFWFDGYVGHGTAAFMGKYYLSGDIVEQGEDGSISFLARSDDVITTSGYRVGPFDVQSALLELEAVIDSAVIGKPDPHRTEIIKAFVVLKEGWQPSDDLVASMQAYVKARLSAHAYPREIEFVTDLPRTPSGKVQRFLLRQQELAKSKDGSA